MAFEGRGGDFDEEQLPPRPYDLPELPWERGAGRLEQLTISILRFDARLEASGLAAGWQSRCDMTEAVRALILDGHLVDVGDLVLHDAGMDVRHPTHELRFCCSFEASHHPGYDGMGAREAHSDGR